MFLSLLILLVQAAAPALEDPMAFLKGLGSLGVGGGIAVYTIIAARAERKDLIARADQQREDELKRYEDLAKDFRAIVQDCTASNVRVSETNIRLAEAIDRTIGKRT